MPDVTLKCKWMGWLIAFKFRGVNSIETLIGNEVGIGQTVLMHQFRPGCIRSTIGVRPAYPLFVRSRDLKQCALTKMNVKLKALYRNGNDVMLISTNRYLTSNPISDNDLLVI